MATIFSASVLFMTLVITAWSLYERASTLLVRHTQDYCILTV